MNDLPQKVTFRSGKNTLVGNLYKPSASTIPKGLLFLHGGGAATKERYSQIQAFLTDHGIFSLSFDFQGVGESEGQFEEGTLNERLKDAQAALHELEIYVEKKDIVIVGCSMGGHIATKLAQNENLKGLILLYSAAYSKEAEDKLLNEEFTQILRKEKSWEGSPAFTAVKKFLGNSLIIYGQDDSVIPKEVQQRYKKSLEDKGKFVVIPYGTHALLAPKTPAQEQATQQVFSELLSFLEETL